MADLERSIVPEHVHTASVVRPYAEKLLAGNEEEYDNVFFEYTSNIVDGIPFEKEQFEKERHGLMIECLFNQKVKTKEGYEVAIPRPTKSCRPDWVLKFRGTPLAYGEGKSSPQGDTVEGLSYTTVCAANILNFMPFSPAIVMHSTNARFRFQAIRLDTEEKAFQVLQRDGMRYDTVNPTLESMQQLSAEFTTPPIMYKFERVSKSLLELTTLNPHFDDNIQSIQQRACVALKDKETAENLGRKKLIKVESSPARSYIEDDLYADPYSGDGEEKCLVLKVEDQSHLIRKWRALPGKLRQYLLACFEAIDVTTALLMEQDPDGAVHAHEAALSQGRFVKPVKHYNMKSVIPFDREICPSDFLYSELRKWRLGTLPGHSMEFLKAQEEAGQLFEEQLHAVGKFEGVTPARVLSTPTGGAYPSELMPPSAHKVAAAYVKKEIKFVSPVKRLKQQAAAATPVVKVDAAAYTPIGGIQPTKLDF